MLDNYYDNFRLLEVSRPGGGEGRRRERGREEWCEGERSGVRGSNKYLV